MGQGDSARDFDPSERMENAGILCVFPIFHTARLGQKIRHPAVAELFRGSLIVEIDKMCIFTLVDMLKKRNRIEQILTKCEFEFILLKIYFLMGKYRF